MNREIAINDFDYLLGEYQKGREYFIRVEPGISKKQGNISFYRVAKPLLETYRLGEVLEDYNTEIQHLLISEIFELTKAHLFCLLNNRTQANIPYRDALYPIDIEVKDGANGFETWIFAAYLSIILRDQSYQMQLVTVDFDKLLQYPESNDPWTKAELAYLHQLLTNGNNIDAAFDHAMRVKNNPTTIRVLLGGAYQEIPATPERAALLNEVYFPVLSLFQLARQHDAPSFNQGLKEYIMQYKAYLVASKQLSNSKYWVNFPLIAACAYAHDQGVRINVESDYLPKWLIEGEFKYWN